MRFVTVLELNWSWVIRISQILCDTNDTFVSMNCTFVSHESRKFVSHEIREIRMCDSYLMRFVRYFGLVLCDSEDLHLLRFVRLFELVSRISK